VLWQIDVYIAALGKNCLLASVIDKESDHHNDRERNHHTDNNSSHGIGGHGDASTT